jgi:cephalosporin-C deacetylase
MKRIQLFLLTVFLTTVCLAGKPAAKVPALVLDNLWKWSFDFSAKNWVFYDGEKQQLRLTLENTLPEKAKINVVFVLKTDKRAPIDSMVTSYKLSAKASLSAVVDFKLPAPGFYRCTLYLEKDGVTGSPKTFNIGYEPEKVVSPTDAKPDFEAFWKNTRAELNKVNPEFQMELMPERSTGTRNLYHVSMKSFGELTIEGFYAVPKQAGKYPAIIYYMGYGSEPWYPHTDGEPGFASFVLSVRGQGIQKAPQKDFWGDWIVWGLDSKENYYYRGAFMDLVRGVDFLVSRPEVDAEKIVAEGGSQGGAFTLAACALDHRIKAAAPTIPFLSDYRDYFQIVGWPRSSFEAYLAIHPEKTWENVYDVLTYFDIKNLAGWIQCPVFMAAGLQDEVCPPHTNFAGYNQIKSEKQYRIYREQGHGTPAEWNDLHLNFFKQKLGL